MSPRAIYRFYMARWAEAMAAARGFRRLQDRGRAVAQIEIAGHCRRYAVKRRAQELAALLAPQ